MGIDVHIKLVFQNGVAWHGLNGIHVKGLAFGVQNNLWKGEKLAEFVKEATSEATFEGCIKKKNEQFRIVFNNGGSLFIGVDPCRIFPVFYKQRSECICIFD